MSTANNVVKLELISIGEDVRLDPDAILEAAMGKGFTKLVIIGEFPEDSDEDELFIAGSANAGESLILMELAKLQVIGR